MITLTTTEGVTEMVLERPPCNELGLELLGALESAVDSIDLDATRALVVRSAAPAGFCAGADLRELHAGIADRPVEDWLPELRAFLGRIHSLMSRIDSLPVTTVAAIHGVCFGGGLELALTCDVRIAERTARFAFPELRLGIIPGFGGIPRLRRDVGNGLVRDLLLTGRSINAKRALEAGLVAQVVPVGRAVEAARATARQAAKYDREAVATAKSFMKPALHTELDTEKEYFVRLIQRDAARQALAAFCESTDKRPYLI